MRILLSGAFNPSFEAIPEYLVSALRRLGHEVVLFDHRAFILPGRLRARMPLLDRLDRDGLCARFLRAVRRLRPDLVLVNQGMTLPPDAIARARDLGARAVNWFSDFPAELDLGLKAAPAYDAFYLASSFAARKHREAGHRHAAWLPFACDPEVHRPAPASASAPDREGPTPAIVFVGSHYPERQVLLRFLRGLPVGVWGPGWERARDDAFVAPMIRGGPLRPAAWRALYASSRVALNIHYGAFGPPEVSGDLASTRTFEILACGAYQVSSRQGDVLRLFREGEELSTFASGEELRARVEEALDDDDLRRAVAERGRASVLASHTYLHRARMLLEPAARGFVIATPPGRPEGARSASGAAR